MTAPLLLVLLFLCTPLVVSYNAYDYDMVTPMFTPDGRLLQVEYASRACAHSSPLVVVKCNDNIIILMTRKSSTRAQDRLIVLDNNINGCVVGMSGVLSDSLSLLSVVQRETEKQERMYGRAATLSSQRIATIMGNACQSHAFGGGLRPYGSNMVVCGLDGVYQTDPSGAVVKRMMTNSNNNDRLLVVGGSEARQAQVKSDIYKRVIGKKKEEMDLGETLQRLAKILLQDDKTDDKQEQQQWLEVAVLSTTLGVHRLTEPQVQALIQTVDNKKKS